MRPPRASVLSRLEPPWSDSAQNLAQLLACMVYETPLAASHSRFVGDTMRQVLGLAVETVPSQDWIARIHADDRQALADARETALTSAEGCTVRYRVQRADAAGYLWIEDRATVVRDADGVARALRGVLVDITEMYTAIQLAQSTESRYRLLFDANPAPLWIYDLHSLQFLKVNDAALALYGYSRQEFLSLTILDIRPLAEALRLLDQIATLPAGLHDFGVWQHVKKDGSPLAVHLIKHRLDYHGHEAELVLVLDMTQQVAAIHRAQRAEQQLQGALIQTIELLAATAQQRDPYTAGHQHRVAKLAQAIGIHLQLSDDQLLGLRLGALVHDLGKLAVPAELLALPRALSPLEFALIKEHAAAGHELLKDIALPWPVATMVRNHHERLDGSGYPDGLRGDDIGIEARILAVADTVEAMASHRPYRAALGLDRALQTIKDGAGSLFDASVVDACCAVFAGGFSLV